MISVVGNFKITLMTEGNVPETGVGMVIKNFDSRDEWRVLISPESVIAARLALREFVLKAKDWMEYGLRIDNQLIGVWRFEWTKKLEPRHMEELKMWVVLNKICPVEHGGLT